MADLSELREYLAERSHIGWMEEKQRQGFADHTWDTPGHGQNCWMGRSRHHPDMLPYADLAENIKDYDRKTVDGVLAGIEAAGYRIVKDV